jgi:hypothetical protein
LKTIALDQVKPWPRSQLSYAIGRRFVDLDDVRAAYADDLAAAVKDAREDERRKADEAEAESKSTKTVVDRATGKLEVKNV